MPDWGTTTARVLCRLRFVTLAALKNATEQQKAAINRVWEFVGVEINEYNKDMSGQWRSVNGRGLQPGAAGTGPARRRADGFRGRRRRAAALFERRVLTDSKLI